MTQHRESLHTMQALAAITRWRRGQEIYGREDPTDHWYVVVSGAARKCVLMPDGQRQIVDFLLPGDFFGFAGRDSHEFDVEAITEGTLVARYRRRDLEALGDADPLVARRIRDMAFETVCRLQIRLLILGRMTALEKVGAFLLEMTERSSDGTVDGVVLPMSRYDIADYVCLAVETVSRTLTDLKARGVIRFVSVHRLKIVDYEALRDASQGGWKS